MSDLISRKKISGYITMVIKPYVEPFEGTAYELGLKIMRYIDAMDSAYDVDKVIEELKDAKHDVCLYDDDLEYYQRGIDKAIEIVKAGVNNE